MTHKRTISWITTIAATLFIATQPGLAAWPERTVRIVVSNAPGGPTDALARILANEFSLNLGTTFIVENKPGAASNIGIASVANAEPDGHTLLVTTGAMTVNPAISDKLSYDPLTSFAPISLLATSPLIIASSPKLPVKTMADLIKLAKAQPDLLNYSTPGRGTAANFAAELIKSRTGITMAHVPHAGAAPAAQAVLTGAVQLMSNAIESGQPMVEAGQLVALAVTGAKRWPALPQTPTLIELGLADVPIEFEVGFYAPAKIEPAIVGKLSALTVDALRKKEIVERLKSFQMEIVASSPDELRKRLVTSLAFYGDLARKTGLKP